MTVDQVNEIIGENSLPETDACIAPYLEKKILNYVPNSRRKGVENRDKDLTINYNGQNMLKKKLKRFLVL